MPRKLIIGSRGSDLALWQANFVLAELEKAGVHAEVRIIKTQGDKIQDVGFDKMEGKGFFTKELEEALLKKEIDVAVHSHKDLPTISPPGLMIAAVSMREDASELLLIHPASVDDTYPFHLKKNAKVGTSSARRKSQWLALRPDCTLHDLRGNVPTRVKKVQQGEYDAVLIAAAGVERLQLELGDLFVEKLSPETFVPAPAQGVLALQCRDSDAETLAVLQKLHHPEVEECIRVERTVLNLFDGGCQLPLGVFCEKVLNDDDQPVFRVFAAKASAWDKKPVYLYYETSSAEGLAEKIVERFHDVKPCSVFISRDRRKHDLFCEVLEGNGFTVHAKAMIRMEAISLNGIPSCEWVFFSSKNAVRFFFDQKPVLSENVKIGAVGKTTADEIRKFRRRADFIGQGTDTKKIGKQFSALVGNRKVLFPQAKDSMRSIQLQLTKKENAIDLPVYQTIETDFQLPSADCRLLVFTSPSNVDSYLKGNSILAEQKIIAMGDATAHALKKSGVRVHAMPPSFTDIGLLHAVFKTC